MPLNSRAVYSRQNADFAPFSSRRSTVHGTNGIVTCTQPLAAAAGQKILSQGGNAAVCPQTSIRSSKLMFTGCSSGSWYGNPWCNKYALSNNKLAAALNVTEPSSTGIGGDMFCLYYDAKTKKISSLNGSGRYPSNVTLDKIRADLKAGPNDVGGIPMNSVLAVTTPGAAAGWVDTVEKFGSGNVSLQQVLQPAIDLAEEGFPVSELASSFVSTKHHKPAARKLTALSGKKVSISSGKHLQMRTRCSEPIPRPKMALEALSPAKYSRTQQWQKPSAPSPQKVKRASMKAASLRKSSKSSKTLAVT